MEKYSHEAMEVDEKLNDNVKSYKDEVEVAAMILCSFKSKNEPWWKKFELGFPDIIPPAPRGPPPFVPLQEEQDYEFFDNILDIDSMEQEINRMAQPYSIVSTTKQLYKSDVIKSLGRLNLNKEFVEMEILESLLNIKKIPKEGIAVKVYDNQLQKYDMFLKDWGLLVLTSDWNDFRSDNDFQEGESVQIWAFLDVHDGRLCFAICRC